MSNVYIELLIIATIISYNIIHGNKNSVESISPDDRSSNLIPIEEWFRKVSDPKFDCNQSAETRKIGTSRNYSHSNLT